MISERSAERRFAKVGYLLLICICVAIAALYVSSLSEYRPPRKHMSARDAQEQAYFVLQVYCNRRDPHDLDLRLFARPKVVRGRLRIYNPETDHNRYVPTWDFYYTYKGIPHITVLVSYDSEDASTEVVRVYEPYEKWP